MLPLPLTPLFDARHIAVIGASQRMETLGGRVFAALLHRPFDGRLTPVNLRRKTVAGLAAYAAVAQIGETPDAAVVAVNAQGRAGAVAACAAAGVPCVLVLTADGEDGGAGEYAALLKAAGGEDAPTQLLLCGEDGFNLPQNGLYANGGGLFPAAGRVALIGRQDGFCRDVFHRLDGLNVGFSFAAGLTPAAPPDPWLNRFREDAGSHVLVVQYLPGQDAAFYSTLRLAAQDKQIILHAAQSLSEQETALLHALCGRCGALPTRTPDELRAAVHAACLPRLRHAAGVHILGGGETGWLADMARAAGVQPQVLPAYGRHANPLEIRDLAAAALNGQDCRALLVSAAERPDAVPQLVQLQKQSETPLYLAAGSAAAGFSDGLLTFDTSEQAVRTLAAQSAWQRIRKERQTAAKPPQQTPSPPDLRQAALLSEHPTELAAALHLPPTEAENLFSDGLLSYRILPHYGAALEAQYRGQTVMLLPPFDTGHARRLNRFFGGSRLTGALEQLLFSLNAAAYGLPQLQSLRIRVDTAAARMQTESLSVAREADGQSPPFFAAAPLSDGRFFTAADGRILFVRPLLPEDAEALQQFVRNMDENDRRTRFMSAVKELPGERLARFSRLDYAREAAVAAWYGNGEMAGWAQYACLRFPDACEFGIAVAADMKGQGLAQYLMRLLVRSAGRQGYRSVCAEILAGNAAMLALAAKLGFKTAPSAEDGGLFSAKLPLQKEKRPKNRLLRQ